MSVLLVTATKVESKAVLDAFEKATVHPAKVTPIDRRVYFDLGTVNGTRVHLARSEMGGMRRSTEKAQGSGLGTC